jgi:hypothetical protein
MTIPRGCCERVTGIITGSFYDFVSYFQAKTVTETDQKTIAIASSALNTTPDCKQLKSLQDHKISISSSNPSSKENSAILASLANMSEAKDLFCDILDNTATDDQKLAKIREQINNELTEWKVKLEISNDGIVNYVENERRCYQSIYLIEGVVLGLQAEFKDEGLFDDLKELFSKLIDEDTEIMQKSKNLNEKIVEWLKDNETARAKIPELIEDLSADSEYQSATKLLQDFYNNSKSDSESLKPTNTIHNKKGKSGRFKLADITKFSLNKWLSKKVKLRK